MIGTVGKYCLWQLNWNSNLILEIDVNTKLTRFRIATGAPDMHLDDNTRN